MSSARRRSTSCPTTRASRIAERYVQNPPAYDKKLLKRVERDALTLCRALGYDLNTVEFAVEDGIPYAIDFMNPAPDAALDSVGQANFEWIVREVADLAIAKAKKRHKIPGAGLGAFLGTHVKATSGLSRNQQRHEASRETPHNSVLAFDATPPPSLLSNRRHTGRRSRTMTATLSSRITHAPIVLPRH